ncbi:MAG: NAD(P)-binding protein [Myxococcota bacterium]|nr:NAD(P)-binding protein [Myxococcota bacterium]
MTGTTGPAPEHGKRARVAIIGGGCAGVAAAFELTRPELCNRFEVTIYQQGWRLGGKGASGRGPSARIEEHGLHVWMGFYENAFRLMRECYAELDRDPETCRIASFRDAFFPEPTTGLADRSPGGDWLLWAAELPPAPGLPGDPDPPTETFSVASYLARSLDLLRALLEAARERDPSETASFSDPGPLAGDRIGEQLERISRYGQLATLTTAIEAIRVAEGALLNLSAYPENAVLTLLDVIGRAASSRIEALVQSDDELRRVWEMVDLVLAVVRGSIRFGLVTDPRGFEAIDDYDCREWLLLNGASEASADSAFVRSLYDLAFAYEDGDPDKPRIAAGQALRGALRAFFTYRGSFFWKMSSGMGDVVFAPFYEVLERRGVRFEFFHELRHVRLSVPDSPGSPHVAALDFRVQAHVREGRAYQPLIQVGDLPCWPASPLFDQLVDGERLQAEGIDFESFWDEHAEEQKRLEVVRDFDFVVLAVGGGAVAHVCGDLIERDPRWRAMTERCKSVATQAFQLWMSADMQELGWKRDPITLSGFVEPFDTWADMTHLASEERWSAPPGAIAYFCSPYPAPAPGPEELRDPSYPARHHDRVRQSAIRFLRRDILHLWPRATRAGDFRWDLLQDEGRSSPDDLDKRFDHQFWTANVNPTDRYSLSLPGTLRYRISPLDGTYDNLTVAGDWTACGFEEGCVEAAVMSGRLAAHALSGLPRLEDIVGFDHP